MSMRTRTSTRSRIPIRDIGIFAIFRCCRSPAKLIRTISLRRLTQERVGLARLLSGFAGALRHQCGTDHDATAAITNTLTKRRQPKKLVVNLAVSNERVTD